MTPLTDFFHFIAWLFEDVLFVPMNALRHWQDTTWWGANILNFIFIIIAAAAFIFWMKQLKKYNDEEQREADKHFGKYWNRS